VKDFKQFLARGNLIDLAVAVVVGVAFAAVVTSLVEDLITPLIAAIFGEPDFSGLSFELNGSVFRYGDFLNALFSFAVIAAVIFLFVIRPVNALMDRLRTETADESARKCPQCLSEVPAEARRCAFCTSTLEPAAGNGF
jgi:large conductance mechanosensitive channel